jgi:phosphatidylserine decarboxylase
MLHAPGAVAAIGIAPMIGQRRQEFMQQIAVGAMNLQHIEIRLDRAQRA